MPLAFSLSLCVCVSCALWTVFGMSGNVYWYTINVILSYTIHVLLYNCILLYSIRHYHIKQHGIAVYGGMALVVCML